MSRFNTLSTNKTENLAGGESYSQSYDLELLSILLTSFAQDQFYKSSNDTFDRLKELVTKCDKKFVAQAAIYARTKFGMRSITHVVASELAKHIGGESWASDFYNSVVYRPDDITEILSYHTSKNGKITNAMKKGLGKAFGKFDPYSIAKYRGEGKGFKLVDAVNLLHPTSTDKNNGSISALVKGSLKSFDTWETELTKAGQIASNEEEKIDLKKDAWTRLILERKIGYFALLRNMRNIIEQAPDAVQSACEMLVDEKLISKSLVLPFRFITAFEEIVKLPTTKQVKDVVMALVSAVDISLKNVPVYDGETLVVLDVSGSMGGKPSQIGSLFSAILVKSNNADFMAFAENAKYINVNSSDSTITIANSIKFSQGGTNFNSIFPIANKKYDRVIILSDMQGWIGYNTPSKSFNEYCKRTGSNPFIYSFDLTGYGFMQFPENRIFTISGFSDKIFDIMKLVEQDKHALINQIKNVEF